MRRHGFTIAFTLILSGILLATLVGCSKSTPSGTTASGEQSSETSATKGSGATGVALGKQIYLTGVGSDGQQILTQAPKISQGALMLGGGGCASCHGADGRGGTIRTLTGPSITSPNVTYATLVKLGFKDPTLRWAIQWCQDEEGQILDPIMPCWQMSDSEADATVAYLKTLK